MIKETTGVYDDNGKPKIRKIRYRPITAEEGKKFGRLFASNFLLKRLHDAGHIIKEVKPRARKINDNI